MINFDDAVKENIKRAWSKSATNPWSSKPNINNWKLWISKNKFINHQLKFNHKLINHQPDIDKIYLYVKDPFEAKYQFFIKKREDVGTKHFSDSTAFTEYSNNMDDIY